MFVSVLGLDVPEELATGWDESSQLLVAECRPDGSIDFMLATDSGNFRYLATVFSDQEGVIEAPPIMVRLGEAALGVLETNTPVIRRRAQETDQILVSLHPLRGKQHRRVAVIMEPAAAVPAVPADPADPAD